MNVPTADNRAYLASVLHTFAQIPCYAQNSRYAQPLYVIVYNKKVKTWKS